MMSAVKYIVMVAALCLAVQAGAAEVRVFKPVEEGQSPMQLRQQAMKEGFAQAITREAVRMVPGELGEVRTGLLQAYFQEYGQPFIQGYKVVSSEAMDAGLILQLDVSVNRLLLRQKVQGMGLMATVGSPQEATVAWPEAMSEEAVAELVQLMTLTGVRQSPETYPHFVLEIGPEQSYRGRLVFDEREWTAVDKSLTMVWFDLWRRFFSRAEVAEVQVDRQMLTVNGWFTPDATLEFDRVLRGWDSAVQEVELVGMDMQPTGVGGVWSVRLLNVERLKMQLDAFLPQRGLSYQLSGEEAQQ